MLRLGVDSREPKPTVILLHGLGSSKDRTLISMYRLAAAGFDVIAMDLYLHGDRPEAIYRQQLLDCDFVTAMRDIIYESAGDIPAICEECGIDYTQCGVLGISAGGFAAHVLAVQQPQFKALVAAISSPDWLRIDPMRTPDPNSPEGMLLAAMSPVNQPDCYAPLPVCMLNGALDETVRPDGSQRLYERLAPIYESRGISERAQLVVYPELGHTFTDDMLDRSVDWFERHLKRSS